MRNTARIIILTLSLCLVCSCTISGTITDENGAGIEGITVSLTGKISMVTTTDGTGKFTFSDSGISNGSFRVTPSSDIYTFQPDSRSLKISGSSSRIDFIAIPKRTCISNEECDEKKFCEKKIGNCDGKGQCVLTPAVCPEVWAPVCGCDGVTYSNACDAAQSGVNIQWAGECRDSHCDDGTEVSCKRMIPNCAEDEILAYQNNCYACVNPLTCSPWGTPECTADTECPGGECDPCGSSSCANCDDCVPACIYPVSEPGVITAVKSTGERDISPDVSAADLETLVDGNTDFAFNLYHHLSADDDANVFFSPYSLSTALAMLYAGAENNTKKQMAGSMQFDLPEEKIHAGFNYLDIEMDSRGEGAAGADGERFRLNAVNAIWGQKGYELLPPYLNTLAIHYGAGLNTIDFIGYTEQSRLTINQWVADQTENKITDLLPQGSITTLTRLVLTNAVYFNAAWKFPFKENQTTDEPFYISDENEKTVATMHQVEYLGYAQGENFQAISIPYDGNELSMVILLPAAGQFAAVEADLDSQMLDSIMQQMRMVNMDISLPKWEYRSKFELNPALASMGMPDAFNPAVADFSGIDGTRDLFVQGILHEAFVKVNEAGTEATAATGVVLGIKSLSLPPPPQVVKVDRPFIYVIRDIQTKIILFVGRVIDPTA